MSVIKYTLVEFESIKHNLENLDLDDLVKSIIDNILITISSPGYTKTPFFSNNYKNKNHKKYNKQKTQFDNKIVRDVKHLKATKIKKNEGVDKIIDNIRNHINKITDKTYDTLIQQIISCIDNIDQDNIKKIANIIFKIISGNMFYSKIYAKLYNDLIKKNNYFSYILNENINEFFETCKNIIYVDANDNYDLYCENNKTIQSRRSLLLFYVNMNYYDIISETTLINLIKDIQLYIDEKINTESIHLVDELFELLFISITNYKQYIKTTRNYFILEFIINKSKLNKKDYLGFSNKSKFKCFDIIDLFKKHK
jgi:hypothetical protein